VFVTFSGKLFTTCGGEQAVPHQHDRIGGGFKLDPLIWSARRNIMIRVETHLPEKRPPGRRHLKLPYLANRTICVLGFFWIEIGVLHGIGEVTHVTKIRGLLFQELLVIAAATAERETRITTVLPEGPVSQVEQTKR